MKTLSTFLVAILITGILQDHRGYIVKVGDKAPEFYLENKEQSFLEKNQGKVIMLQFTASWCGVCLKEMPFIEKEIWETHKNNPNFLLIGLAKDTEQRPQRKKEIEIMIRKTGATYPILTDHKSKIFELFAEKNAGVTRNIIISQNGEIAFLTRLFEQEEFNEMKTIINELLINNH
tara:strand:+ start:2450 stop:2977 length:528 start_codon:yes stop_codon:yes gene_type:complete